MELNWQVLLELNDNDVQVLDGEPPGFLHVTGR